MKTRTYTMRADGKLVVKETVDGKEVDLTDHYGNLEVKTGFSRVEAVVTVSIQADGATQVNWSANDNDAWASVGAVIDEVRLDMAPDQDAPRRLQP